MQHPINVSLISALSLFALLALPCESKETDEPFKVSKADTAIQIDGKLDAAWKQTEVRSLEYYRRYEKADDRQKTKFRMLWDDENVYVFFECKDKYITARETKRDGQPYFDDCAEIFLIPANEQLNMHYGFELNLYKASNDFIFLNEFQNGEQGLIKSYNPDFDVAVSIDGTLNDNSDTDTGWTMELAIPLKLFIGIESFSPVAPGNRWAFQAIRQDRNDATGNRRSWGTLFEVDPEHPRVHEPEDFGFLEFVE
ncbi:MAG: carbohydrate-binding family 9-like protein [Opitutaceae bacterium]|nr:carbohydrate-binding family 9-like protein [Opitutaceae bacterium]